MAASRHPLALLAAATLACGGDDLTLPNEGQPSELTAVRGNGQNGTVGEPLADSLVVRVRDRFGNPVAGVEVSWTAEGGGTVEPATAITDEDGHAGAQRTLGEQPGVYTTIAAVSQLPDDPVTFTTTGVAAKLSIVTQPAPSALSGVPLERQPAVQLLDADGNPVARAGVVVTVQIASGGGTLGGTTSVGSDPNGLVTFTDLSIRGSPGIRTLLFAADAFASAASAPIALGVGAPASIAATAGEGQSATVNTAVATPPAVVIRDGDGNPVSGIPVVFAVASGGGSVSGATVTTGPEGVAQVGGWTLGTQAGPNTLRAEVEGLELQGSPVTFTATGTAGPLSLERSTIAASPTTITASTGGTTSRITVTALDGFGNPIRDLPVSLSATGTGNVLTQPDGPTNDAGAASGRLAATGVGPHVVSASISGQTIPANATVTVTAAAPVAGNSSASVGNGTAGVRTPVIVDLKDGFGNPVTGAGGRIAVAVSGANTATGGPAEEQGDGRYTVAYTPLSAGVDQIVVLVDGAPVPGSPLTSVVAPGPASPGTTTAVLPSRVTLFTQVNVVVTVRDAQENVRTAGGDEVRVIAADGLIDLVASHNGDGTYSASFLPPVLGQMNVEVLVNGAPILGSPFQVTVTVF
jgi:adhesin/invasin